MSIEQKRRLILALDIIIRNKIQGRAIELSERLDISRSTVYRLLEYMRNDLNAPIFFSADENRYAYKEDGLIFFGFLPEKFLTYELNKYINEVNI